jgi:predicted aldo/keto reductase-like oxidoreductase
MKGACAHLGKGAHGVANGVSTIYKQNNAKLATLQIKAAFKEFQKGSSQLAVARKRLLAIGGTGFKG